MITRPFPRSAHATTTASTCSMTPSRPCSRGATGWRAAATTSPSLTWPARPGAAAARPAPGSVSSGTPAGPRVDPRVALTTDDNVAVQAFAARPGHRGHPGPGHHARLAARRGPAHPRSRAGAPHLGGAAARSVLPGRGPRHDRHPATHGHARRRRPRAGAARLTRGRLTRGHGRMPGSTFDAIRSTWRPSAPSGQKGTRPHPASANPDSSSAHIPAGPTHTLPRSVADHA